MSEYGNLPRMVTEDSDGTVRDMTPEEIRSVLFFAPDEPVATQEQSAQPMRGGRLGDMRQVVNTGVNLDSLTGQNVQTSYETGQNGMPIINLIINNGPNDQAPETQSQLTGPARGLRALAQRAAHQPGVSLQTQLVERMQITSSQSSRDKMRLLLESGSQPSTNNLLSGSQEKTRLWDKYSGRQKIGAGVVAGLVMIGAGATATDMLPMTDKPAAAAAEANLTSKEVKDTRPEFQLRPVEIADVARYDAIITASTMWNFTNVAFDAKKAVATPPNDPSFDFIATPELIASLSVPYDAKVKAISEQTKKGEKVRIFQVDMSKVELRLDVDPKSLEDTQTLTVFKIPKAADQDKALAASKIDPKKFRDIYEKNKNDAETQAIGSAASSVLADTRHKAKLLEDAKTKIVTQLGLSDQTKYSVRFINDDKFAAQPTAKDVKFPDIEALYPQASVADLMKRLKFSGKQVRLINGTSRKPSIAATLKVNEEKPKEA